ncbi:sulfatase [Bacteroidia bacterium]|nr:sulfatase [Bacteroidia bacterium]
MKARTLTGISALPLLLASAAEGSQQRNNVLYIMTDQQSWYAISAITQNLGPSAPYGNIQKFKTPNLDRLVKSGYTFSNCYAASPVSGPSRFALLTGESPNSYGMSGNFTPKGERMPEMIKARAMGNLFKNAGYQTFYGGKVHLPWANGNSGKGSIYEPPYLYGFDTCLTDDDRQELAQKGSAFFSEYKGKEPFLLFLSFMNPHDICAAGFFFSDKRVEDAEPDAARERTNQVRYREIYKSIDPKLFEGDDLAKLPVNTAPTDRYPIHRFKRFFRPDQYQNKVLIWLYYRLVEEVDGQIGQVLDALEKSPYKDNTTIIFTSDHGEMGGSHDLTGKNVPYQECQRVPLIFAGKGIQKGVIDNTTPVCNGWDMLPTMLQLSGVAIPKELHGMSLCKTITGGAPLSRKYLYLETTNSYGVIENGRYKYTRFVESDFARLEDGSEALVDLEKDPYEMHNLVFDKSAAAKLNEMRAALAAEMKLRGTTLDPIYSPGAGPKANK